MTSPAIWLERYAAAWSAADDEAVGELFTDDAVYRSGPFREPHVGRDAIRAYWREATSTQSELELRLGEPVVEGTRMAVEWWAIMRDRDDEVTLPGCLVLRFAGDGRCEELREYWHVEERRVERPAGWGV